VVVEPAEVVVRAVAAGAAAIGIRGARWQSSSLDG